MYKYLILTFVLLFAYHSACFAQSEEIARNVKMVANGNIKEVEKNLPELMSAFPNDPGVKLLQGIVCEDANKALELYYDIVNNYSYSEWADDAYWRIVQYHAVSGNIEKATEELKNYRTKYPDSEFLIPACDIVRLANKIENRDKPLPIEEDSVIKMPKDTGKDSAATVEEDGNGEVFGLQVAIYSKRKSADQEMAKYKNKRIETEIIVKKIKKKKMYAVVVGNYSSREKAENAKELISGMCNCKPMILKK